MTQSFLDSVVQRKGSESISPQVEVQHANTASLRPVSCYSTNWSLAGSTFKGKIIESAPTTIGINS